jgi:IclR family transcriptional regulator, KDG regulon repressor
VPNASERLSDVLEILSQEPAGLSVMEVGASLSMSRAATFRLLNLMVDSSLLEKDSSGQYRIALRLWSMTAVTLRRLPLMDVSLLPMSDGVRCSGHTIILGVNRGLETYFLRKVEMVHDYVLASVTGHRSPINVTATGKAILAFESEETRDAVLADDLPKLTPLSLSGDALAADLEKIRERGYAVNYGEGQMDARGIAVPVFDSRRRPIAGVGTSVPVNSSETDVVAVLQQVSSSVSRALGYLATDAVNLP